MNKRDERLQMIKSKTSQKIMVGPGLVKYELISVVLGGNSTKLFKQQMNFLCYYLDKVVKGYSRMLCRPKAQN